MLVSAIASCIHKQVTTMSAATGLMFFDFVARPFFKIGMKFPILSFLLLFMVYAAIAYVALRSAYLAEANH